MCLCDNYSLLHQISQPMIRINSIDFYLELPFDSTLFSTTSQTLFFPLILFIHANIHRYFQLTNEDFTDCGGENVLIRFVKLATKNFHQTNSRRV